MVKPHFSWLSQRLRFLFCIKKSILEANSDAGKNTIQLLAYGFIVLFFVVFNSLSPVRNVWGFNFSEKISSFAQNSLAEPAKKISFFALITPTFLESKSISGFGGGEEIPDLATIGEDTVISSSSPLTTLSSLNQRDEVMAYRVQPGDNPTTIAASFGITLNTLLWANDLSYWALIRPGDELIIPPISGVVHKVQSGDTVSALASKYKAGADDIIAFNNLPADGALQAGQTLIIPDGEKTSYVSRPVATRTTASISGFINAGQSHPYPYGQCTWWVAQKRPIPNWGNANTWLRRAEADGYSVCYGRNCQPQQGAIVALKGSGWLAQRFGHVAYVEKAEGNQVTFSEMNYIGWAKISTRTLPVGDWNILGYIY